MLESGCREMVGHEPFTRSLDIIPWYGQIQSGFVLSKGSSIRV
jgi:hypothetical protein